MTTSLVSVGSELSRAGVVSLLSLTSNGFTRTYSTFSYLRVNPFSVANGGADNPISPVYSLSSWSNYDHTTMNTGSGLSASEGYGSVVLEWARPAGYSDGSACLRQFAYIRDTGETTINEPALAFNPFTTPDQTTDVGDASLATVNVASYEGFVVALGVKALFDDSATTRTNADSVAYDTHANETPLTGGGRGIAFLVWPSNPGPLNVTQTTDPDSCSVGEDVTINIQCVMRGTSTGRLEEQVDGGSWTLVDSSVAAASSNLNVVRASDGSNYKFRLRYNDVSPDDWATQTGTITPTCNLL